MSFVKPQASARNQASVATAVVRALLAGDVLTLERLTHADVVDGNNSSGAPTGWAGLRERALTVCGALPEGVTVELVCSEGDTAICRVRTPGHRRGFPESASPDDLVTVLFALHFRNGLVSELWSSSDFASLLAAVAAA